MQLSVDNVQTLGGGATTPVTANDAASSDRFLKLLVAQMQNQDPLNPMDNAQVTTQMAQISTVDGIAKLNTTVQGLNGEMVQLQAMQGATLVGRDVTVIGNQLSMQDGKGVAGFEIASAADRIEVEIMNSAGTVIDRIDLGAQSGGRHSFEWSPGAEADVGAPRFRVVAHSGAAELASTPLMLDHVKAVSFGGNTLNLELSRSGTVPYGEVVAFN